MLGQDLISEKQFQKQIIGAFKEAGWNVYHNYDSRRSTGGWPDLQMLDIKTGRLIFVEVKRESGKVRKAQRDVIEALQRGGAEVYIWRPSDKEAIYQLLQEVKH